MQLRNGYYVVPFPTQHRVQSYGFILYKKRSRLKPEYEGLSNEEIKAVMIQGHEIREADVSAELAYTGKYKSKFHKAAFIL